MCSVTDKASRWYRGRLHPEIPPVVTGQEAMARVHGRGVGLCWSGDIVMIAASSLVNEDTPRIACCILCYRCYPRPLGQ